MDIVIRVGLVYLFLMAALRLMGKREFSQLAPFEFVTLLLIPELLGHGLAREDYSLTTGFIGVATLLSLVFITSVLAFMSRRLGRVIDGDPAVLIHQGFMAPDAMAHERISPDELLAEMHKAGLETTDQVKWAVLEADGKIAIVPWVTGSTTQRGDEEAVI